MTATVEGPRRRRINPWLLAGGLLLFVALALGLAAIGWMLMEQKPLAEAESALQSDSQVAVESDGWLAFQPAASQPETGLIIYPGAGVDPAAYAPIARAVAEAGHLAVIVPMPLNLAFFSGNRAEDVIGAYPEIASWAIAGHSLGGVAAALFAESHPELVSGLVLWASYPADSTNLSNNALKVTSVYGSRDGLTTMADIEASRPLLPADSRFVAIEGGNHAQFGSYGEQRGDNPAEISRSEQQAQIAAATLELLRSLSAGDE